MLGLWEYFWDLWPTPGDYQALHVISEAVAVAAMTAEAVTMGAAGSEAVATASLTVEQLKYGSVTTEDLADASLIDEDLEG
jgi:hypothetical protein